MTLCKFDTSTPSCLKLYQFQFFYTPATQLRGAYSFALVCLFVRTSVPVTLCRTVRIRSATYQVASLWSVSSAAKDFSF